MCAICDGQSYEEALDEMHHLVDHHGWALQGVEAPRPWVYTIGLLERFDHPELVLAGVDISLAMRVLNALGTRVAVGEELRPSGPTVRVAEVEVAFGSVHPVHISAGLMGMWEEHYARWPGNVGCLEVVQVLPLPGHRLALDRPHTTLDIA